MTNGRPFSTHARTDGRSIHRDLELAWMDPWVALRLNDMLSGARLVSVPPPGRGLHLRAEAELDGTGSPAARLARLDRSLERGLGAIESFESGDDPPCAATSDLDDVERLALRDRLEGAGWPVHDDSEGRLAIDVSTPGRRTRANVRRTAKKTFRVAAVAVRDPIGSDLCRSAVARFLLSATGGYRMVRPAARPDQTVHLEVELHPDDSDRMIDLCLGALALASRDHAREVALLAGSEEAAALYAALRPDAHGPTLQEE